MKRDSAFRLHASPGKTPRPTRLALRVAYDGTAYRGWQVQPGAPTIQGELERVIETLIGVRVRVFGSGRTDTGVHAREQTAHVDLAFRPDGAALRRGFNALLQPDIRVLSARIARPEFHARFDAVGKEYRYFIWNADPVPPFLHRYRADIRKRMDLSAMRRAAALLIGKHDFAAFSANPNREVKGTVRTLCDCRVSRRGAEVVLAVRGDGFLYRMVRSLAGHLIRVGLGEIEPECTQTILTSRQRTARVPTAPARGLFLWKVYYGRMPDP